MTLVPRKLSSAQPFVHPSAIVDDGAVLGAGVTVWHFSHVCEGASIGADSSVGQGCHIGPGVIVGSRVRIQNHVSLFRGVQVEDEVFLGPGCTFTNVLWPRAVFDQSAEFQSTRVRRGVTVGAQATILPGITLGRHCFIAAGAVVTHDVPDYALFQGVPARSRGFVSRHGRPLRFHQGRALCEESGWEYERSSMGSVRCLALDEEASILSTPSRSREV